MEQQLVVDRDGEWFVNTAEFAFTDPSTKVRFAPRVHVKVKPTPWMKAQPTIKAVVEDAPTAAPVAAPAPAAAPAKAPAPAPVAKPAKA